MKFQSCPKQSARLLRPPDKDHHQLRIQEWMERSVNKRFEMENAGDLVKMSGQNDDCECSEDKSFLRLSKEQTRFDPVSNITRVFFDSGREHLFAIRSGGVTGVVVKGPTPETSTSFTMDDRGDIMSVKFNSDQTILAIQRSSKSVEFMNNPANPLSDKHEYSQSCKTKSANLWGFAWTGFGNDIIFITDQSVELYEVQPTKKSLRYIKLYTMQTHWFIYQPKTQYLLVSSGILGNVLHPIYFSGQGMCTRHSKFEVDLPVVPKPTRLSLFERDVSMAKLYSKSRIVVLRNKAQGGQAHPGAAEIVVYTIDGGTPRKTNILRLDVTGRFAVNFIDNLIIVHHQSSKSSQLFDIGLEGVTENNVTCHPPIVSPASISCDRDHRLYSPNWVVFQPNIIIDAKIGILWRLELDVGVLAKCIKNPELLIDFILLRKDSRHDLLESLKATLQRRPPIPIVSSLMKKIAHLDNITSNLTKYVFMPLAESLDDAYIFAVMVEHTRTKELVDGGFRDMIVANLIKRGKFYQLHQFLQYHILSDSKNLAIQLLSLSQVYPPAQQLALDMLYRVGCDKEETIETLLTQGKVIAALKVVQAQGIQDVVSARKFLETAKQTQDRTIFYSVYRFFEQRNRSLRGTPQFPKGEMCQPYVAHFNSLFGDSSDGTTDDKFEV